MNAKMCGGIVATVTLLIASAAANALPITGSFSGLASGHVGCYFVPCVYFEDEPLTGSFSFDIDPIIPLTHDEEFDFAYGFSWPVTLTFNVRGQTIVFTDENENFTSYIGMPGDGRSLSLSFFGARGDGTQFTFASSGGPLFSNFDLATFDPSNVDADASDAYFSRDLRFENYVVDVQRIVFDNLPDVAVDEPGSLPLLAAGLLMLILPGITRRRSRQRI